MHACTFALGGQHASRHGSLEPRSCLTQKPQLRKIKRMRTLIQAASAVIGDEKATYTAKYDCCDMVKAECCRSMGQNHIPGPVTFQKRLGGGASLYLYYHGGIGQKLIPDFQFDLWFRTMNALVYDIRGSWSHAVEHRLDAIEKQINLQFATPGTQQFQYKDSFRHQCLLNGAMQEAWDRDQDGRSVRNAWENASGMRIKPIAYDAIREDADLLDFLKNHALNPEHCIEGFPLVKESESESEPDDDSP
jgi:hypothetical protein